MSVPVTARLDEETVDAIDAAVAAGVAPTRAAAVTEAVKRWLDVHGEAEIRRSYERAYATPDPQHDDLVASISAAAAGEILSNPG